MAEFKLTKVGHVERMGESEWMSPFHLIRHEVDTANGVKVRYMPGIKSPSLFSSTITGELTNRKIDNYIRKGEYNARHQFLAERKKSKQISDLMPRLVYDLESQDFRTVFS